MRLPSLIALTCTFLGLEKEPTKENSNTSVPTTAKLQRSFLTDQV